MDVLAVTVQYLSLEVDIVNLRTEEYAQNSRIPTIAIGTPHEDALRRDLTINSLYYNIQTRNVEDFTGRGIDDLQKQRICTPLPPMTTLEDDPLRALRAIRFACRFNFTMDDELLVACSNPVVHEHFITKVSSMRVIDELDRMMETPTAFRAMYLLYKTRLLHMILQLDSSLLQKQFDASEEMNAADVAIDHGMLALMLCRYLANGQQLYENKNSNDFKLFSTYAQTMIAEKQKIWPTM